MTKTREMYKTDIWYINNHRWIHRNYGQPKYCENCGSKDKPGYRHYQWANISKKHKRNIKDYKRLCVGCHIKYDKGDLCKNGHKLTPDNIVTRKDKPTWRPCRTCQNVYSKRWQNKQLLTN